MAFSSGVLLGVQELIVGLVAAGIGLAVSPTMLVIQAAVPAEDMAAATSGWVLVRSMGPSIGMRFSSICPDSADGSI